MSEEPKEPPKPVTIDPLPSLGPILNHFEAMILSNARLTERLVHIVRENNIPAGNMDELFAALAGAYHAYAAFKSELEARAAGKGEDGESV